jgi:hypothetical protein
MIDLVTSVLASFVQPERIGTTPQSMLWMLPLTASVAIVYKATKVRTIEAKAFFKETALLFASIAVFMALAGVILCAIAWFFNEKWPGLRGY